MKNVLKSTMLLCCLFLFTACNSNSFEDDTRSSDQLATTEQTKMEQEESDIAIEQMESGQNNIPETRNIAKDERKVMYTAHMEIVVADYAETVENVTELVKKEKGYIVSSTVHRDNTNSIYGYVTIKIPQERFEPVLKNIANFSLEVKEQQVQGEDVTEEYVDLEARLKAKRDVKDKLEAFLKDATETKDLLAISEQIGNVQEEIEQIEGRLNYLKNETDYSTVTISMTERNVNVGEIGSKEQNTWVRAKQLLVSTMNGILSVISGTIVIVIGLSPIIIPVLIIVIAILIYRKRKKKKEASRE